jgi:hypothetical protein
MIKRSETGYVFNEEGKRVEKHVFVYPGRGIYEPAEDSWIRKEGEMAEPSRLYSYAGGSMLLPWILKNGSWKSGMGIQINAGGIVSDKQMISGKPKESIRLIQHEGNLILVITWPIEGLHTFYIFDSTGRQLTTSLHPWSLGAYPPHNFCREIEGPIWNTSGNIELLIMKQNKLNTSVTIGMPDSPEEKPLLMALTV